MRVETSDGRVLTARALVVATDSPVNDRVVIHTKQPSYRSYVVAFERRRADARPLLGHGRPVSLRPVLRRRTGDRLIVGGEDHRTGQEDDADARYARLEEWARQRFGSLGPVTHRWSGQVQEPVDGLGYIGRNPGDRNVYVATGFSGNGMTHGALAGRILGDLVLERDKRVGRGSTIPGRIRWRAAPTFVREAANTAVQYKDLVTPGEVDDVDEVAPGEGAVIRDGLTKTAVYRDEAGVVHACSAICPHLGCVVAWNGGEKTWDCPCHGSRFDVDGAVLHGPAISPLGRGLARRARHAPRDGIERPARTYSPDAVLSGRGPPPILVRTAAPPARTHPRIHRCPMTAGSR